uniref:Uncharacterized protein n=1 Tax=Rhizophora mucronata TaxID=61149 RepID=A0A2P2Q2U3_RHIMU
MVDTTFGLTNFHHHITIHATISFFCCKRYLYVMRIAIILGPVWQTRNIDSRCQDWSPL